MKKYILLLIIFVIGINCYADNRKFRYITDSIKFVENLSYGKWTYRGWVNSVTNKPVAYGEIMIKQNNNTTNKRQGIIKSGKPDGWGTFLFQSPKGRITYTGECGWNAEHQEVYPSGICYTSYGANCDMVVDYSEDAPSGGLAITFVGNGKITNYYLTTDEEKALAIEKYKEIMYENNKSKIKSICQQNGVKYVEDVKIGIFTYAGGWKDAAPYLYGAYYGGYVVFHGYFSYTDKNYTFTADGDFYEQFSNYVNASSEEDIYYRRVINENRDTFINRFGFTYCENIELKHDGSQYIKQHVYKGKGQFVEAYKSINDRCCWGLLVDGDVVWEGELTVSTDRNIFKIGNYGRYVYMDGTYKDKTISNGKKEICKYADGSYFLSDRNITNKNRGTYTLGEFVYSDGSYVIGFFGWDRKNAVYGEMYDKDDNFIKGIVDMEFAKSIDNIDGIIAEQKERHKIPIKGYGTIKLSNGEYTGNILYREPHGFGKIVYTDGDSYEGEWNNGYREGKGKYVWKDGDIYDGEWNNDKRGGFGTMIWTNGKKFEGYWINGNRHGNGVLTFANGDVWKGVWDAGTFQNGEVDAKYNKKSNRIKYQYIGAVKGDGEGGFKKEGFGKCVFDNGDTICGDWVNDTLVTEANLINMQFRFGEPCNYNGMVRFFSQLERHGLGICIMSNGDSIHGRWSSDKLDDGKGTLTYKYGHYTGSIVTDNNTGKFIPGASRNNENNLLLLSNGSKIVTKDLWDVCEDCTLWKPRRLFSYYAEAKTMAENVCIANGKLKSHKDSCTIVDSIGNTFHGLYDTDSISTGTITFANGDVLNGIWHGLELDLTMPYTYTWADGRTYNYYPKEMKAKPVYSDATGEKAKKKVYQEWQFQPMQMLVIDFPFEYFCK